MHGDTLHRHSISVGSHAPVGIFASQIHASLDSRFPRGRKRFASLKQFVKAFTRTRTAAGRAELDVTLPAAGLGARADVADGHALEARRCRR